MTSLDTHAAMTFLAPAALEALRPFAPFDVDLRTTEGMGGPSDLNCDVECTIRDARAESASMSVDTSGFTLVERPSAVQDWYDSSEVARTYYEECKQLARELTGAPHAFTFDHIIREPGRQIGGGGTAARDVVTTTERGGGYIGGVHMDYTDSSEWTEYLALHGCTPPAARRVVVLNFWRPLLGSPDRSPLALCDARTVTGDELLETMLYGYGHEGYSWHDIGISVYQVASSPAHRWWYYPGMTPDEVLLIKTYDSDGVVGRGCPHASFQNPLASAATPPRRSIELRVLCFIDGPS